MAPPCYAFCYEQAVEVLDSSKIFHVVILDLRLPEKQGLPEVQDQDLGLDLLDGVLTATVIRFLRSWLSAGMSARPTRVAFRTG